MLLKGQVWEYSPSPPHSFYLPDFRCVIPDLTAKEAVGMSSWVVGERSRCGEPCDIISAILSIQTRQLP